MPYLPQLYTLSIALLLTLLAGCSDGNQGITVLPGELTVTVVDGSSAAATPVAAAHIQVIDATTGNPIDTLSSDANGQATAAYYQSNVQLKVSAQGYASSPASGIPPLPVALSPGANTPVTITLYPLDPTLLLGTISGQLRDHNGNPVAGALVVADNGNTPVASNSDGSGNYLLYNVPAGSVTLNAWSSGLNFPPLGPLTLAGGETLSGQNISASGAAAGSISGHVSFTAVSGAIIDITLLHPGSREVIPGLRSYTDSNANYTMSLVPNGTFEIIASLENDGYVLDPDTSVTQGVPVVSINNDSIVKDFKVTGSIALTSPPAPSGSTLPQLSTTPTFSWLKDSSYASAEEYVVEVVGVSSNTIWGGFGAAPAYTPQVTVAQGNTPGVSYNFDGTATLTTLEEGQVYQLRVYAKKDDAGDPRGYKLLSASETLDGLFRVFTP